MENKNLFWRYTKDPVDWKVDRVAKVPLRLLLLLRPRRVTLAPAVRTVVAVVYAFVALLVLLLARVVALGQVVEPIHEEPKTWARLRSLYARSERL